MGTRHAGGREDLSKGLELGSCLHVPTLQMECLCPPNSYVEALRSHVAALGDGASEDVIKVK